MALTLEQEAALLALLNEKRTTLPELTATSEVKADDLLLTNQLLADKSVTAKVLKDYIAPLATLDKQGIVQLSNAINSDNEIVAATSKAVKTVNSNANSRVLATQTVNGHPLAGNIEVTSPDIFNDQAISIGVSKDLNSYETPGIYFQDLNVNAANGKNYPEANAGSLMVYRTAGVVQVYRVYNSSRVYSRAKFGTGSWTAWVKEYNTANPPSAGNVGRILKLNRIADII